jgi:hypothetical protein
MNKTTIATFAMLLTGLSTSAVATTVAVNGTANIYGAISLTGAGDGSGTAPPVVAVTSGSAVDITSTGTISCGSFCGAGNGADGGSYSGLSTATAITSPGNGLSGITFTGREMFLVGVFINSGAPPTTGAGPTVLNYGTSGSTATDASDVMSFQPGLNQVFFIGDGTEGNAGVCPGPIVNGMSCTGGALQTTYVPTGANELFLGFTDGAGFSGPPADFNDNTGALNTTVSLVSGVPEPGTMLLMGFGLVAVGLLRKKLA